MHKQKVFKREYLEKKDKCSNAKDQFKSGRFKCLNDCFTKNGARLSFYTHDYEGKFFNLNLIENESFRTKRDIEFIKREVLFKQSQPNFQMCLERCKKVVDCFYETTNVVRLSKEYFQKLSQFTEQTKLNIITTIYEAYYSTDDFYLQFFGLLTLFTGTCVTETVPKIVRLISKRFNLHSKIYYNLIYRKFKFYLTSLSLVFVIFESAFMIKEYRFRTLYPNKTSILNFEFVPQDFYLVLCFPIETIIYGREEIELNINKQLINNFSFHELELKTNLGFKKKVKSIRILHGLDAKKQDLEVDEKVLFKNEQYDFNNNLLSRCFLKKIIYDEYRFKTLMPINNLIVHFRTKYWTAYLIEKHQNFTSGLVKIRGEFYVNKKLKKNSILSKKSKCKNYGEEMDNCSTRLHCKDFCINEMFRSEYGNLTMNSVIDKNSLNDTKNIYFIDKNDKEIENKCQKRFENWDCVNAYFSETLKTSYRYDEKKLTVNLNFEKSKEREIEPSFVKMVLNIINLESVFFGSNMISTLTIIFLLLSKRFEFLKCRKVQKILALILTFFGFFIHNLNIFNGIIKTELVDSGFFSTMDKLKMPQIILCFEIENYQNLDHNFKLTGDYLDEFTKETMNYDKVFGYVWYFNKTHRQGFKVSKEKNWNKEISITHFYYLNLKCFEISLVVEFEIDDFYVLDTRNILGTYLKSDFAFKNTPVYFLFRETKKRKQFSNSFFFKIKNDDEIEIKGFNYTYEIHFEQFEISQKDHFETFKDLKSIFYKEKISINDATVYLDSMIDKFKKQFNKTTKEIILENHREEDFKMEIDDQLFVQFFLQVQNVSDYNQPITISSDQHIYNIYVQHGLNDYGNPGMVFSLSLLKRKADISNEDNYTKVLQSFLNTLSLWLKICILDVVIFIRKVQILFVKFYELLKSSRIKLKASIF